MHIKRILCLIFAVLLCFAVGCDEKGADSSSAPAPAVETGRGGDENDPENRDNNSENGTTVGAEELVVKTGKANGIDVSKWQGKIDWQAVKKSGIDFAMIRIGFRGENGTIYKDSCADYNLQQAEKAGVLVGVYFYSTAKNTTEAEEEARWTAAQIAGYPISYPVAYDCEGVLNPGSRIYGLSNQTRTDNALAFLNRIAESGYEGMVYSAYSELTGSANWDTARLEKASQIWLARYPNEPYPKTEHPDYAGRYDMWQYTDRGRIGGITGNVDLIVSYFTKEKAAPKDKSARPDTASAPSNDSFTAVSDEVTAKMETNLRDAATTKSNVVAVLKNGTFLQRTGTSANGWSRLTYEGRTVYAITSYLTTDRSYTPPVQTPSDGFTDASGQLTAKDVTNLRAAPSTSAELVATIHNGEFVTRTGTNPNGWTRLSYNGRTVYAKTSLLTDKVNSASSSGSSSRPDPEPSDGFTAASGKMTAKDATNLRTAPNTGSSEVVYTLKNGEFAERIGVNRASGWTKLTFNGQTVYAVSSYLLTEEEYNTQAQSSEQAE